MTRVRAVIVLLMALGGLASAQRYSFKRYGPDEGLKTSAISSLLQDSTGFLWVATSNGLYRYDGEKFQRLGKDNELPSQQIRFLRESVDKTLWIVTGKGLVHYVNNHFQTLDVGLKEDIWGLSAIDSDAQGKLYLGFSKGILLGAREGNKPPKFARVPNVPEAPVTAIHVEPDGSLWFGCGQELCFLKQGKTQVFGTAQGLPPERWQLITRDSQSNLWMRGHEHLYMSPAGTQTFVARDQGLPPSTQDSVSMLFDAAGRPMVSTDLGVAVLVEGKWQLIGSAQGLESDSVSYVLRDREGSIWVGLWGAGLARWLGETEWTSWTKAEGLPNNLVWAIKRHPNGDMWIGTDTGLARLRPGAPAKVWRKEDGLGGNKIKALAITSKGIVWVGSSPGGVSRLDPSTGLVRAFGAGSGLADDRVIAFLLDDENRLWVSTAGGLFRSTSVDGEIHFDRQTPPGANDKGMFFRFLQDGPGHIWITSLNGLFLWDHGRWTRIGQADGLKSDAVTHVSKTDDGAMWVGYREPVGLTRISFSGGKTEVQHFGKQKGLASDYVLFLGLDAQRSLWVGTDDGVAARVGGHWYRYDRDDGLIWNDCAANAFLAEADGGVWIGTLKGLSHYQPNHVPPPQVNLPVVITLARFGTRSAESAGQESVPFRDRDFSVNFSALGYRHESKARFRYRLIGLEDDWTETNQREARYSSLPPGTYRFEVSAQTSNGEWTTTPAVLVFTVLPPWWRTWWAEMLEALICVLALVALVRLRLKKVLTEKRKLEAAVRERTKELQEQHNVVAGQKLEIERLLERQKEISRLKSEFLANMSHEIRTPLNGIIGMTQLALTTDLSNEQFEYLSMLSTSGQSLLMVINDILDFSKIEAGKMELASEPFSMRECLAQTLSVFALKALEKGLDLSYCVRRDVPDVLVGDAGRLRQILLNLVGNALKFTETGKISVDVQRAESSYASEQGAIRSLLFQVSDTGVGIPVEKQSVIFDAFAQADSSTTRRRGGTGLGLAICSKLVHLMHGQIWVESVPDQGSNFFFTASFGVGHGVTVAGTGLAKLPDTRMLVVAPKGTRNSYLEELVQEWGVLTVTVSNHEEALNELQLSRKAGQRLDWIVIDGAPEDLRSSRLHQALFHNGGTVPVILLSAAKPVHGDQQLPESLFCLSKPLNANELHACLTRERGKCHSSLRKQSNIPRARRSLRILLAEDNSVNQVLARKLLEKMGHTVGVVGNGIRAVAAAAEGGVDLILMDVQMPEMDGFEATQRIRQAEKNAAAGGRPRHVAIVAMTAHAMSGDRELCLNVGMDDYVSKPIEARELHAIIEKLSVTIPQADPGTLAPNSGTNAVQPRSNMIEPV